MERIFNSLCMKNFGIAMMAVIVLTFCSSSSAIKRNQPSDAIVGTWVSKPDGISKWVFTNDSKTKIYLEDNLKDTFTYSISGTNLHCGYDVHEFLERHHNMKVLELSNVQNEEKKCYFIFGLNQEHLSLRYFGSTDLLFFKRQQ